jgi:predicted CXXCH cytochrome family protein
MNKVKWSFSLLLAFFLVGILSTAAFASDLYSLKAVQKDSGLDVSFNGNSNSVPADVEGTQFDIVLKYGSDEIKTYSPVALDGANHGKLTIPSGDLKSGKTYKIQLFHTADKSHSTMLSGVVVADVNGSGLLNANETGLNNTNKSRSDQKVHGVYQNNTNSCASCHQTHGASDNNLLLKDGVYSTCSACHDGTTGAFNYFSDTTVDKNVKSISGTFDISADVAHGSMHQADGTLQISAAPGGNNSPDTTSGSIGAVTWNQDFDCASCHAPHGAGSADENNLNIDPMGWGGIQYVANGTKDQQDGKLFKGITVQDVVPTTKGDPYILVRTTAKGVTNDKKNIGYLYSRAGITEGQPIIQTYRWDGTANGYVPDYSLWLRDTGYKKAPFQKANTVFYDSTGKAIDLTTADINAVWRDGFASGADITKVKTADLSVGIDVETTNDLTSLYDPASANYVPDSGVEMTKYCTACHTDYMVDSTTGDVGVQASFATNPNHRHAGVTDQLTCVRCHYAHGTKASIMKASDDTLAKTTDSLSSENHSSALRRYVDYDSCYTSGCHSKTVGNPLFLDLTD